MEQLRKPLQGIGNIIRFNWHFYLLSASMVLLLFLMERLLHESWFVYTSMLACLVAVITTLSLVVSFYIYDLSSLYKLSWIENLQVSSVEKIINIHAGFDETSALLARRYPQSKLLVLDFYDPTQHTEISIRRARNAYPPFPNTRQVSTTDFALTEQWADRIFVMLSAHEIRNETERIAFFREIQRVLKETGQVVVTEHLRDVPNFLAYTIGFFHFFSRSSWHKTFKAANLKICKEQKITPFISTFILEKNGTTS